MNEEFDRDFFSEPQKNFIGSDDSKILVGEESVVLAPPECDLPPYPFWKPSTVQGRILSALKVKGLYDQYFKFQEEAIELGNSIGLGECCALASWCYYLREKEEYDKLPSEEQNVPLKQMKKPFCLLKPDEMSRSARKIGLKPKGDIFEHPERKMPVPKSVEEKMKEEGLMGRLCMTPRRDVIVKNSGEQNFFAEASDDDKVRWARAANSMYDSLGQTGEYMAGDTGEISEDERILKSMEFACLCSGIPIFDGDYADPIFIKGRMDNFRPGLLEKEVLAILKLREDSLSESDAALIEMNDLIRNPEGILEALIPTVESLGLIEAYKEEVEERELNSKKPQKVGGISHAMNTYSKMRLAVSLINSKGHLNEVKTKENITKWIKSEDDKKIVYADKDGNESEVIKRGHQ
ncbi:MAG: hypothetical protein M0R32_10040 [Candidatus Cloacimonetes bacterium]|jgi:hypothetical protein|nr:hypothetical protein [Candidatus Cloacimonadota bacterium]